MAAATHKPGNDPAQPETTPCHVAELARRARAVNDTYRAFEDRGGPPTERDREMLASLDRLEDCLADQASFDRAQSDLGALFQLHILARELDTVMNSVGLDADGRTRWRAMERLIYALQRYISQGDEGLIHQASGDVYLPQRFDVFSRMNASLTEAARAGGD